MLCSRFGVRVSKLAEDKGTQGRVHESLAIGAGRTST